MKSANIFKKLILPKIVLVVIIMIAHEVVISFPFMRTVLWGKYVQNWVDLLKNLLVIVVLILAVPGFKDFFNSLISETLKDKYEKWTQLKKDSLLSMFSNFSAVIIVFISYKIISDDINLFVETTTFDTIIRILFLIVGLFLLYKGYMHFNKWVNE